MSDQQFRIVVGSDDAGFDYKEIIKQDLQADPRVVSVVDVGVELSAPTEFALKLAYVRRRDGRFTSVWRESALTDRIVRRQLTRRVAASDCMAVLQIQDLAELDRPYFLYQGFSFDALLALLDERLGNDPPTEQDVVRQQLAEITSLRLRRLWREGEA